MRGNMKDKPTSHGVTSSQPWQSSQGFVLGKAALAMDQMKICCEHPGRLPSLVPYCLHQGMTWTRWSIRWKKERLTIPIAKGDVGNLVHFWLEICINAIFFGNNLATSLRIKKIYIFDSNIPLPGIYPLWIKASKPKDILTQKWTTL